MKTTIRAAVLAIVAATGAQAQDVGSAAFGLGVSTLGPMIQGSFRITPMVGLRAFYAGIPSLSGNYTVDGTKYKLDGSLGGGALMADLFLPGSGFRLSGGVFVSHTKVTGKSTASLVNPINAGGLTFTAGETVNAKATFKNKVAPIISAGYVHQTSGRWAFSAEAGGIWNNGFNVTATGTGLPVSNLNSEVADLRKQLNKIKVYPFVSLMANYSF